VYKSKISGMENQAVCPDNPPVRHIYKMDSEQRLFGVTSLLNPPVSAISGMENFTLFADNPPVCRINKIYTP